MRLQRASGAAGQLRPGQRDLVSFVQVYPLPRTSVDGAAASALCRGRRGVLFRVLLPALRSETMLRLFSFGGDGKTEGNCEMTIGAIAYALLNYFGQRYFVFSDRFEHHREQKNSEE